MENFRKVKRAKTSEGDFSHPRSNGHDRSKFDKGFPVKVL